MPITQATIKLVNSFVFTSFRFVEIAFSTALVYSNRITIDTKVIQAFWIRLIAVKSRVFSLRGTTDLVETRFVVYVVNVSLAVTLPQTPYLP